MKLNSRKTTEVRKVGDEGVFDFQGMSYDEAISALSWYYQEKDGTDTCEMADDGYDFTEDDCCDCGDEGDYAEDMKAVNHVRMPIMYFDFTHFEPITASSFIGEKPLSDVDIRETVALIQRGIMSHNAAYDQLLSAETVRWLADEMTRDLVVPTPNILK